MPVLPSSAMRILFLHRPTLPESRARSIRTIQTAAAVARAGFESRVIAGGLARGDFRACLSFHGIGTGPLAGRLSVERLDSWGGMLFGWRARRALRRGLIPGADCVAVINEMTPESALLAAIAKGSGMRVILDLPWLSPLFLQRGRQQTLPPPPPPGGRTFSMLSLEGKTALKLVGEDAPADAHQHDDHDDHHDDHEHEKPSRQEPELPPNLDQSPAPPPPSAADSLDGIALREALEQQADLEASLLTIADGWIFPHRAMMEAATRSLTEKRPRIVMPGGYAAPEGGSPPPGAISRDLDILYYGDLGPEDGVETAIAAMPTLYPHKLAVAGTGTKQDRDRLRQAALSVGVFERVTLLPEVAPADAWKFFARAKVGVLPIPGIDPAGGDPVAPLALFEMMAAGMAIVASRLKAINEYAADGKEAILVTPDDPRPLADGIRSALADPGLRDRLGAAAKSRAASYTWDTRAGALVDFATGLTRTG